MKMVVALLVLKLIAHVNAAPEKLSQAGLYQDFKNKIPAAELQPYSPRFPLWSDGLEKSRWIRLPGAVDKTDPEAWVFPDGTELWKEFRAGGKRIETRRMRKNGEADWEFASYVWNADESEATLAPTEGLPNVYPLTPTVAHDIPSEGQCRYCHQRFGDPVLGFSEVQLGSHAAPFALGYLHANCASCHHPEGRAGFTEHYLQLPAVDVALEQTPAFLSSVNVPTVNFPIPGVPRTYRVLPGHPEQSALIYRLTLAGPQHMPSLGTKIPDVVAIEKLREWVLGLSPAR